MSYDTERSAQAVRDIEEAFIYIAEDNLNAAESFLTAVEESIETLSAHPLIGNGRPFQNNKLGDLRIWQIKHFKNYLLVYKVKEQTVTILRLLNVNRDFSLLFD